MHGLRMTEDVVSLTELRSKLTEKIEGLSEAAAGHTTPHDEVMAEARRAAPTSSTPENAPGTGPIDLLEP